jgi:plastocyanin
MQHSSPPETEDVVLGENRTLANAVVYLQGNFAQYSFEQPSTPTKVDQKGCVYIPHVTAVMAGSPVRFMTSDATTHNVHAVPSNNRQWNESQASGAAPLEHSFAREEVAFPVKCNLHPWMRAYVAVLSHPYFQVTGKDGSFELRNVPPGTYTLIAWHEFYGTTERNITISPKQEQSVDITFSR